MICGGRGGLAGVETGAGGGVTLGAGVCVEGGTVAAEVAGGATAGGALTLVAAGPLLAAIGAVAQVPTQWSGGFGAACEAAVAVKASRTSRLGSSLQCECLITGVNQPRKKVAEAPYYAGFVVARARSLGGHGRLSRIVAMGLHMRLRSIETGNVPKNAPANQVQAAQ